jgi:hypothetical protein
MGRLLAVFAIIVVRAADTSSCRTPPRLARADEVIE